VEVALLRQVDRDRRIRAYGHIPAILALIAQKLKAKKAAIEKTPKGSAKGSE
jgi:hypothetical protein